MLSLEDYGGGDKRGKNKWFRAVAHLSEVIGLNTDRQTDRQTQTDRHRHTQITRARARACGTDKDTDTHTVQAYA